MILKERHTVLICCSIAREMDDSTYLFPKRASRQMQVVLNLGRTGVAKVACSICSSLFRIKTVIRGNHMFLFLVLLILHLRVVSAQPTIAPSIVESPTSSVTAQSPTVQPITTISPAPTTRITSQPTTSFPPTVAPTTALPSMTPSVSYISTSRQLYQQSFVVPGTNVTEGFFTDNETISLGVLYSGYTPLFAPDSYGKVDTLCIYSPESQRVLQELVNETTTVLINTLEFTCDYESRSLNVENFTRNFLLFVNTNLPYVTQGMTNESIPVLQARLATFQFAQTNPPTVSPAPSWFPSPFPSVSPQPSLLRSPTALPTTEYIDPPTFAPSTESSTKKLSPSAITAIIVVIGLGILAGLALYFRYRVKQRHHLHGSGERRRHKDVFARRSKIDRSNHGAGFARSESERSKESLVSQGVNDLGIESGDELDNTKNLQDEFDQYKDKNLEQLRTDVEGNLSGFEGVLSAAVTKALMGDEDAKLEPNELLWGCHDKPTGEEVEASALCEVNDWMMRRNENSSVERNRSFMQDMLNKMVASVRYGVVKAADASRTIHESAALLGLELANELPVTTVVVSGMKKTVKAEEVMKVFEEFGEVETAAVASGERGFGIVRFRHFKSVERALRCYRNDEIVVEEVAVLMKVILPNGEVLSRA